MSFMITPGNAMACSINAHRHGWDGRICERPTAWTCGGVENFRRDYCDNGDSRCFHINAFNQEDPRFVIPDSGAGWILGENLHAFDDQVLILWNRQFSEPIGMGAINTTPKIVYGAYRVQSVEVIERGYHRNWMVRPYPDGWVRLPHLKIHMPRWQAMTGPYIKEIERMSVLRLFEVAAQSAGDRQDGWFGEGDKDRLEYFVSKIGSWLDISAYKAPKAPITAAIKTVASTGSIAGTYQPLRQLKAIDVTDDVANVPKVGRPEGTDAPIVEYKPTATSRADLAREAAKDWIEESYGSATLRSILVGSLTKPLLILRGSPGVGKSTLALKLIDDAERERTHIETVVSTWRGREDLFGYVNPVDGVFEATPFARFLKTAEKAWFAGDKKTRLVVFEEFNLSQPEYWLSDILVRVEYDPDDRANRTIQLGGEKVRGFAENDDTKIYLAPTVRFVATVNTDHTTRKLSPRVLDRASVIELAVDPGAAMRKIGLLLELEQIEAIKDIDFRVKRKGAGFSFRSALSLRNCLAHHEELRIDSWSAIDQVLVQEVLSKIQLLTGDPEDMAWIEGMSTWSESYGARLPECTSLLATWKELLDDGRDVIQA